MGRAGKREFPGCSKGYTRGIPLVGAKHGSVSPRGYQVNEPRFFGTWVFLFLATRENVKGMENSRFPCVQMEYARVFSLVSGATRGLLIPTSFPETLKPNCK